jgi:hypothetical protein
MTVTADGTEVPIVDTWAEESVTAVVEPLPMTVFEYVIDPPDEAPAELDPLTCSFVIDGLDVTLNQPAGHGSDRPIEVNWGDGSGVEDYHGSTVAGGPHFPATHTYAAAGTYTITLDPLDDPDPAEAATIEVAVEVEAAAPAALEATEEGPPAPELELAMKPVPEPTDFNAMTKAEICEYCYVTYEVELDGTQTKAELVAQAEALEAEETK